MSRIAEWFANGQIAWLIAGILVGESGLLILIRNRLASRRTWNDFFASQAAGLALVLALQAALVQAPWMRVAAWLLLAFAAHLAQLIFRWKDATGISPMR